MDELIDVLDERGVGTGVTKTKAAVHRDGDWHRAAHVWIVAPDGRVLFQRRSSRKENWPGRWDVSAAGHLSAGESAVDAAIRETFEELGVVIANPQHIGTFRESCVLNGGAYIDNEVHEVFVVRQEPSDFVLQDGEVDEVMWVDDFAAFVTRDDVVPHAEEFPRVARTFVSAPGRRGTRTRMSAPHEES